MSRNKLYTSYRLWLSPALDQPGKVEKVMVELDIICGSKVKEM